jgi:hypothetical protein
VGRKVGREQGRTALALIADMEKILPELTATRNVHLSAIGDRLSSAINPLKEATQWIAQAYASNPAAVAAGSVYYLKLMGITCGGWMMARAAREAARQLDAGAGRSRLPAGEAADGALLCRSHPAAGDGVVGDHDARWRQRDRGRGKLFSRGVAPPTSPGTSSSGASTRPS